MGKKLQLLLKLVKVVKSGSEPIEEIAQKLGLDLTLAWAMRLDGLDDLSRLRLLSEGEAEARRDTQN